MCTLIRLDHDRSEVLKGKNGVKVLWGDSGGNWYGGPITDKAKVTTFGTALAVTASAGTVLTL